MGFWPDRRLLTTVLGATGVAASVLLLPGTAQASAAPTGTAIGTVRTPGIPLNIRTGPSTDYPLVGTLKNGTTITIGCQTPGMLVRGYVKTSALWDRLPSGRYVADGYVKTGSAGYVAARCAPSATPPAFVQQAVQPARQSFRDYRVPASVTIAQAILESGWGRSGLSVADKNYFGVKCGPSGPGPIAVGCRSYPTTECDPRGCHPAVASFRVYRSMTDSFCDHGRVLATNPRYRAAFQYSTDPDRFIAEVRKAGYATDPAYTAKVVDLMRRYDLYRYDG